MTAVNVVLRFAASLRDFAIYSDKLEKILVHELAGQDCSLGRYSLAPAAGVVSGTSSCNGLDNFLGSQGKTL